MIKNQDTILSKINTKFIFEFSRESKKKLITMESLLIEKDNKNDKKTLYYYLFEKDILN